MPCSFLGLLPGSFGVFWPSLDIAEVSGNRPRILLVSCLKSFLHLASRSMAGISLGLLSGISRSVLASSGDS